MGESQIPASRLTSAWYWAKSWSEICVSDRCIAAASAKASRSLPGFALPCSVNVPPGPRSDRLGGGALQSLPQQPGDVEDQGDPAVPQDRRARDPGDVLEHGPEGLDDRLALADQPVHHDPGRL